MTRIDFADGAHKYFGYDADSKRVSKQDSDGFTEFIYEGPDMLKLLLERDEQGGAQDAFEHQYDKAHARTLKVDGKTPATTAKRAATATTAATRT